jgi:hypothetical protein
MTNYWISLAALMLVHLGFAALLGSLIFRLRAHAAEPTDLFLILFGGVVFVGASLALPFGLGTRLLFWVASLCTLGIFSFQLETMPSHPALSWYYAAGAAGLILAWSLSQGWPLPTLSLGLSAALAAGLAWRRALGSVN